MPHPRLRIRALMALVMVLGGAFGWVVHRAHTQRDAIAAIVRSGGKAFYDWEIKEVSGRLGATVRMDRNAKPRWPKWLIDTLGPDYLCDVRVVHLGPDSTDSVMRSVGRLTRLGYLTMESSSSLTDAGMAHLRDLDGLKLLAVSSGSTVTRTGLENLRGKVQLEQLMISDIHLTDDDIVPLEELVNLRHLLLDGSQITSAGLARLARMTQLRQLRLGGS